MAIKVFTPQSPARLSFLAINTLLIWLTLLTPAQAEGNESEPWEGNLDHLKDDPANLADPSAAMGLLGALISNLINLAIIAGAVTAFIMLIWGGYMYMSSENSPDKAKTAKRTILYAVIGLILMSLTYIVIMVYNMTLAEATN